MNPHELTIAEKDIAALAMDPWYGSTTRALIEQRAHGRVDSHYDSNVIHGSIGLLAPERASFLLALIMVQTP